MTFGLYLPSHTTAPDFEATVEANTKEEALKKFREEYPQHLADFSNDELLANIENLDIVI